MAWAANEVINSSARMRRLSGSIPTSYTMMKIDSTYYAECNVPGGTAISPDTDATTVLQNIVDALPNGASIWLREGTYTMSDEITVDDTRLILYMPLATVEVATGKYFIVFKNQITTTDSHHSVVYGGKVDCQARTANGFKIDNSYGVHLEKVQIEEPAKGILITSSVANGYSESSVLRDVLIRNPSIGLEFLKDVGSGSYVDTYIENLKVTLKVAGASGNHKIGVKVGADCKLWCSVVNQSHIWFDANYTTGWVLDGQLWNIPFLGTQLESFVGSPTEVYGIDVQSTLSTTRNFYFYPMPYFTGTFTTKLRNASNVRWGGGFHRVGTLLVSPDGTKLWRITVNDAGTVVTTDVTAEF